VPLALFLQPLAQSLHQLVEAAQRLDLGLLLVAEVTFIELAEPVLGDVRHDLVPRPDPLDAVEHLAEHLVEAIVVLLVLDQHGAGQVVEVLDRHAGAGAHDAAVHGLHQVEPLLGGNRHPDVAKGGEEGHEHQASPRRRRMSPSSGRFTLAMRQSTSGFSVS
jgi:hypothetical protein